MTLRPERTGTTFPFTLPLLAGGLDIELTSPVTFLVGENGSGKSTLIEAIAWAAGFDSQGGSRDHRRSDEGDGHELGRALALAWSRHVAKGFYLRAETFFDFATYLESLGSSFEAFGRTSPHVQSHGEAFLSLLQHGFGDGFYVLDEPEAALSPQRQLAFLVILDRLARGGRSQFLIATHSPMLLAFPGATVLSADEPGLRRIAYQDTDHYRITRAFLESPERYFGELFRDDDSARVDE